MSRICPRTKPAVQIRKIPPVTYFTSGSFTGCSGRRSRCLPSISVEMTRRSLFVVLLGLLSSVAGFTALSRAVHSRQCAAALGAPVHSACRAPVAVVMADADGPADDMGAAAAAEEDVVDPASDVEPAAEAAEEEPAAAAAEEEEEEEEEDLLSTPAFLKQKLKVLEKELAELEEKTVATREEATVVSEEWSSKRERLQGDFDNFKARHVNQTLEAQLEARIKARYEPCRTLDAQDARIGRRSEAQQPTSSQARSAQPLRPSRASAPSADRGRVADCVLDGVGTPNPDPDPDPEPDPDPDPN